MYTLQQALPYILGITIVMDTGIYSDHDLIITKCDLGIQKFHVSTEKEERMDFRSILSIPMTLLPGKDHPTLSEKVFKGIQFQEHAKLYQHLQSISNDVENGIIDRIMQIKQELLNYEATIINRTKLSISIEDQLQGRLIQRTQQDAEFLNSISSRMFATIYDVCRQAKLVRMAHVVPAAASKALKKSLLSEKIMPGIATVPVSKQLDDAIKRIRKVYQRIQITLRTVVQMQRPPRKHEDPSKLPNFLNQTVNKLIHQHPLITSSLRQVTSICEELCMERLNHIKAIESARNKTIHDDDKPYSTHIIEKQGKAEHETYINSVKQNIFGHENMQSTEAKHLSKLPGYQKLTALTSSWSHLYQQIKHYCTIPLSSQKLHEMYTTLIKGRKIIKQIKATLAKTRQEEWKNAKNHFIRIGKYGNIARMINQQNRSGPVASKAYPSKPGEPVRLAITDEERKEASIITHTAWMGNPQGAQNCHFLDLTYDDIGPTGVTVRPDKEFDAAAQWKYLDGLLEDMVSSDIEERIKIAHQRLPKLFEKIKTSKILTYPFRYDCVTGEYMYPELEQSLRKNASKGAGKARATGFAIPVLGRLPKIFLDAYIIKCKVQMALRLLDIGTETSLRICIGKPCGGVRPLTVGHDDNVFLNALAQQAIQQELARHKILPDNLCSYQKGKGCPDATILNTVTKEIALQENIYYVAEIVDDAEKMFDRLYIDIQAALLLLAGAGIEGFTEWQCVNMANRTNKLVTDIFVTTLKYECGLPQGNGFSVEIANLWAMFLLLWWNMDPLNPEGSITPFHIPRHGYPLMAGGITKHISSLAYVDDALRIVSLLKTLYTLPEFFNTVQGYCDLLAELSLVIKMGRNVKKCTIYLYNIPVDTEIPQFTSIAWSHDTKGPVNGVIATVVVSRDSQNNLLCYQVPETMRHLAPAHITAALDTRKYLGVPTNAQMEGVDGRKKILNRVSQRIGLIASKTHSIAEAKIAHNMLVCQVATYSPICITMTLQECASVDRQLIKAYQYKLKCMPCDAKHHIFISECKGGLGLRSFTREYVGALLRDVEVYMNSTGTLQSHALCSSVEAATKQCLWMLKKNNKLPTIPVLFNQIDQYLISPKKIITFMDSFDTPETEETTFAHTHIMAEAIYTTSALGFMLRDMNNELCARITDEILLADRTAKALGDLGIGNRRKLGPIIGEGNENFHKHTITGRTYLRIRIAIQEARRQTYSATIDQQTWNNSVEDKLSRPELYKSLSLFPKELSPVRLATCARLAIAKFKNDYRSFGFYNLKEWRATKAEIQLHLPQDPRNEDYVTIIDESNAYHPMIMSTMQDNSTKLAQHLSDILQLNMDQQIPLLHPDMDPETHLTNAEILEHATKHD